MQERSVRLHFQSGSSDKVYELDLVQNASGNWECKFAYGRRGASLNRGTKTPDGGATYAKAQQAFEKIYAEKTGKGYQVVSDDMSPVGANNAGPAPMPTPSARQSLLGITPMLPTAIEEARVPELIFDANYGAQQKYDGQNRILLIDQTGVRFGNRRGEQVDGNPAFTNKDIPVNMGRTVLFGEDLGDVVMVFDALEINGMDFKDQTTLERHTALTAMMDETDWLKIAPLITGTAAKKMLHDQMQREDREGVVFKRLRAPFTSGRTKDTLKYKIKESSTFVVGEHHPGGKRSIGLVLKDENGNIHTLGNVTVPPNYDMPAVGALVEVSYMYRYHDGCLEQPVYRGERDDLEYEPKLDQIKRIKHKAAA